MSMLKVDGTNVDEPKSTTPHQASPAAAIWKHVANIPVLSMLDSVGDLTQPAGDWRTQ